MFINLHHDSKKQNNGTYPDNYFHFKYDLEEVSSNYFNQQVILFSVAFIILLLFYHVLLIYFKVLDRKAVKRLLRMIVTTYLYKTPPL
jgi:hypothetical protein